MADYTGMRMEVGELWGSRLTVQPHSAESLADFALDLEDALGEQIDKVNALPDGPMRKALLSVLVAAQAKATEHLEYYAAEALRQRTRNEGVPDEGDNGHGRMFGTTTED